MKKTTKKKKAVFALLLSVIMMGAMHFTASAAVTPSKSIDVDLDYTNETITVTIEPNEKGEVDKVIYFTETYNKDLSRWDVCDVREITYITKDDTGKETTVTEYAAIFDISWITNKKTMRLYLCGDVNTEVIAVDITWEEDFGVEFTGTLLATDITEAEEWKKVYKAYPNFSEDTGYFLFTIKKNGRNMSYFDLDNIQWRKGDDGVWREFDELDLKEMNIRGISLEFRVVAQDDARASSTIKISVSKLMSAPTIEVNPNIMTLAIKNGMEFSFDKKNWIMIPEYNKKFGTEINFVTEDVREQAIETIYTSERITTLLIQEVLKTQEEKFVMNTPLSKEKLETVFGTNGPVQFTDEGIVVYVRDIGTERKAASRISEVIIPYASKDTAEAKEDALTISYGESKTNSSGIVIENTTEQKYQVGVITQDIVTAEEWAALEQTPDAQYNNLNLANVKWTTVKGGKIYRISNKKVPKGAYIVYRIAAEEGQLPSTYCVYGPMKYDALTYVGIEKVSGEAYEAVVSTNFTKKDDGTYDGLTFQWQWSESKAEDATWTDIGGATTSPIYKIRNEENNKYVRVKVTQANEKTGKTIEMISDPVGPVIYVAPKEEQNGNN